MIWLACGRERCRSDPGCRVPHAPIFLPRQRLLSLEEARSPPLLQYLELLIQRVQIPATTEANTALRLHRRGIFRTAELSRVQIDFYSFVTSYRVSWNII